MRISEYPERSPHHPPIGVLQARCPECHHEMSEDEERHYPDCRFFTLEDDGGSSEEDAVVYDEVFLARNNQRNV